MALGCVGVLACRAERTGDMEREILPLTLAVVKAGGDGRWQPDGSSPMDAKSCCLESLLNSSSKTVMV